MFPRIIALIAVPVLAAASCITYPPTEDRKSIYLICRPDGAPASLDLVVFAHGYVAPREELQIPADQLEIQGIPLPALVNNAGFAFATSSYPRNGLVIKEGVEDMRRLVAFYKRTYSPRRVYLAGVSEGGLVAVKSIEDTRSVYSGGLALCAPIGDFPAQINHFDDFRVIFDYYFPGVLPPSPVEIPRTVIGNWPAYAAAVGGAMAANPAATAQLFAVTQVPTPADEAIQTALGVLWYNVFATNDAREELRGQPFDNETRHYSGSSDDVMLNAGVDRFQAAETAVAEMQRNYQTSGKLPVPLVTMHTTGDPIVPYWHETIYGAKVLAAGSAAHYVHLPVPRFGHCTFDAAEVLFGFGLLVSQVSGQPPAALESALPAGEQREKFRALEVAPGVQRR